MSIASAISIFDREIRFTKRNFVEPYLRHPIPKNSLAYDFDCALCILVEEGTFTCNAISVIYI